MTFPTLSRRWNPWNDLLSLQEEMNKLFESTMGPQSGRPGLLGTSFMPPVDVLRDKENIIVRVDLPGMDKEDLEISLLNDSLFIRGEKKMENSEGAKQNVHRRERFYGSFERVIDLPNPVDGEKIRAAFRDGVLEITAPLRPEAKPRQIAVNVS